MLIESFGLTSGLPEYTYRRIESRSGGRLPFKYVTRALDIYVHVQVIVGISNNAIL